MKKNWKLIFLTMLAVAGFAAIAIFAAAALKYVQVKKSGAEIKSPAFILTPSKDIRLGSTLSAEGTITCPWHRWPVKANTVAGKGSQVADTAIILYGIGWGKWHWKVSEKIQPYLNGMIEEGKIEIELNEPSKSDNQKSLSATIPSFECMPLETGNTQDLAVAGSIAKRIVSTRLLVALSALAIIIIIVLIVWLGMKKKNFSIMIIPAWDIALMEFGKLRREMKEHRLTTDACITKLTDIIRNYLEKRFFLHAPMQTTAEFMEDLKREKSPLRNEDKDFLKEFLTAADLVKFAKLSAEEAEIDNAITKAEALVRTTRPAETVASRQASAGPDNRKTNL